MPGLGFWVAGAPPRALGSGGVAQLQAQPRYGAAAVPVSVRLVPPGGAHEVTPSAYCTPYGGEGREDVAPSGGGGAGLLEVRFDAPERAITPGQALVLYDGDVCVGGGVVLQPGRSLHEQAAAEMDDAPHSHVAVNH